MGLNGSKENLALFTHYGHILCRFQAPLMTEKPAKSYVVTIDERIMNAIELRKPIGLSRTAWVNYLLQYAFTHHPELTDLRGYE